MAAFTMPVHVPNDAWSFLYIIPLVVVISVVYKTTKLADLSWRVLARESIVLSASILVFMFVVAACLYTFCALVLR